MNSPAEYAVNNALTKPWRLCLAVAVSIAACGGATYAQDRQGEEVNGAFLCPELNAYFRLQHNEGRQLGDTKPFTMGSATFHAECVDGVVLLDTQGRLTDDGEAGGSIGGVRRFLINDSIVGAGVWYDAHLSTYDNTFQQVGTSFEWFCGLWSLRANGSFPIGNRRQSGIADVRFDSSALRYLGNNIIYGSDLYRIDETAMTGAEVEVARGINVHHAEAFAGYYHYRGSSERTDGFKLGMRGYLADRVAASVAVASDPLFGANIFGGLTLFFGGSGGNRPNRFLDKLTLPVQRTTQVALNNRPVQTGSDLTTLTDPVSSLAILVEHVDSTAAAGGDGTFESPLASLDDVFANSADGTTTNGNIVFVHSGSTFSGEAVVLHDRQRLLGEGILHTVDSTELGIIAMPAANGAGAVPTISAAPADAVTLGAVGNEVSGFTISDGTRAIVADTGATDTDLNRLTIQDTIGDAIVITPSTNTTIDNVTFSGVGGQDIVLNAEDSTITNVTSTGAVGGSIYLKDLTGTTTISDVDITGAGGTGGILLENAESGSLTVLSNVTVDGAAEGLSVDGSEAGSTIGVDGLTVSDPTGAGIDLDDVDGAVAFANTTSVTGRGSTGIDIDGGSGTITFDTATITGTGGVTSGIDVRDTTGTVSFDTANVSGSGGSGIFVENADAFNVGTGGAAAGDGGSITDPAGAGIVAANSNVDIRFMNISGVTGLTADTSLFEDEDGGSEFGHGIAYGQWETGTRTVVLSGNTVTNAAEGGIYMFLLSGTIDATVSDNTVTGISGGILIEGGEASSDGTMAIHDNTVSAGEGIFGRLDSDVIVTDFRNNVVNSGAFGIDLSQEFIFDANPLTPAFDTVEGGTTVIGSAGSRITGPGLQLFGDGALRFDSIQVFTEAVAPFSQEDGIRIAFNEFDLIIGDGDTPSTIDVLNAVVTSPFVSDNAFEYVSEAGSLTLNDLSINMNGEVAAAVKLENRDGALPVTLGGDADNTTTGVATFKDVDDAGGGFTDTITFDGGANVLP